VDDDFKEFHDGLRLSECKKYVIDSYGNEFPHDYPTHKEPAGTNIYEGKDNIREDTIVDDWMQYIAVNKEKYARRIERFISLMKSDELLVILTKCTLQYIQVFRDLFHRKYAKTNIIYVVYSNELISQEEKHDFLEKGVCLCEYETIWVDEDENMFINQDEQDVLWKDGIVKLLQVQKIELPKCLVEDSPPL